MANLSSNCPRGRDEGDGLPLLRLPLRESKVRLSAALVLLATLVGCTQQIFSESEPIRPYAPPEPRDACEQEFATRLMQDIGTAIVAPPSPEPAAVAVVLDACSPQELVAADRYYVFAAGQPGARLNFHRLLQEPDSLNGLRQLCQEESYAVTQACATDADGVE